MKGTKGERMPRVAIPLLLFLKLALMGECTGITFYCCPVKVFLST